MPDAPHFPALKFTGPTTATCTEEELEKIELVPGFRLPRSYRDFAIECGKGLLGNLLIILVVVDDPGSIVKRHPVLTNTVRMSVDDNLFEYEPHGSPELAVRLVPFGVSENGHILAWDPQDPTADDEYMIYALSPKMLAVYRAAPNLYEFVDKCLDERVKGVLGIGYKPLEPVFLPRPVWKG